MPDLRSVAVERRGRVAVVALRRPEKRNAISTEVERELQAAFASDAVREAGCVVVTGDERAFSAGADVSEFEGRDPAAVLDYYRATGDFAERLADLPQPTIAAISGHCLGGGLELALAADFRVADASASFGLPEVSFGILPSSGGALRLVRLVGAARAKELVLLRDRFGPEEARDMGLLTEVADGPALPRALELAERLAGLPPVAVRVTKTVLDRIPESSREGALALERLAYALLAQTSDADAAAAAFGRRGRGPAPGSTTNPMEGS
jgi:enoyl-CoA hydratase/carnithine racemase